MDHMNKWYTSSEGMDRNIEPAIFKIEAQICGYLVA